MKEQMGSLIKTPMTRAEASQILNIDDPEERHSEPIDHAEIMERFDLLFEKNSVEKGGSFYLRSKIFFAKEHLMQDWPAELNVSKVMDGAQGSEAEEAKAAEEEKQSPEAEAEKESESAAGATSSTEGAKEDENKASAKEKDDFQHPNKQ